MPHGNELAKKGITWLELALALIVTGVQFRTWKLDAKICQSKGSTSFVPGTCGAQEVAHKNQPNQSNALKNPGSMI